jgi:hypothetical protein
MPSAGFEPAIPAGKRLQTHVLDRSATGIGSLYTQNKNSRADTNLCSLLIYSVFCRVFNENECVSVHSDNGKLMTSIIVVWRIEWHLRNMGLYIIGV